MLWALRARVAVELSCGAFVKIGVITEDLPNKPLTPTLNPEPETLMLDLALGLLVRSRLIARLPGRFLPWVGI